jgi:DNA repair exonuclease SbcCD ATPase subunit
MSFRSQTGHKSSGRQFSKSAHEKKAKEKKQRQGAKYLREETPQATPQEFTDKTLGGISKLGNQIFALSPFSQYFDDWLVNLRQVVSEFESNPEIEVDDQFQKERTQIFLEVEEALAENRIAESNLTEEAKALAENNHRISDADKEYAEKTRELSNKRNSEVQHLTSKIRQIEDDLAAQKEVKIGFFKFGEKKRATEKLEQLNNDLSASKNKLEITIQNFKVEQDKLHDNYEKRKQDLNEESDRLHKELEKLETDTSTAARQSTCNALIETVKALMNRTPQTA